MVDKQVQKAGDNSQQIQTQQYIVNNITGIDEKRAREIYHEMFLQVKGDYTQEVWNIAKSRIEEFENRLLPKMQAAEKALETFADPAFQLLLLEAQKSAVATERPADYELLSELLLHRFQKGTDRVARTGISRAVEIVSEISDEALLGLTVFHAVSRFFPVSGIIQHGLNTLNVLFGKLCYENLPVGNEWLDHLDILDAIRINNLGGLKKIEEYYSQCLSGYVNIGIEKSSEDYNKAIILLRNNELPESFLVEHELNSKYVRLAVPNKDQIDSLVIKHVDWINRRELLENLNEKQKTALRSIYDLYRKDPTIKKENIAKFMEEWDRLPNLKKLREWWDGIKVSIQITSVGRVLAHANAQRCDKSLPPLD